MFESDFLTDPSHYRQVIARTAEIVATLPRRPYSGKTAAALASLIPDNFLPNDGASENEIADALRNVVAHSISLVHPNTAAHLHCPPLISALAAEVVVAALNQSMDSFDQAPLATVVEQKLIRWLCSEAGLPATGGGTFTTGGSQSNYMGLMLARDAFVQKHWNWPVQKSGLPPEANRLRIFCSDVAHFTVEKSAAQLGLGIDSVVRVGVDEHFRMNPLALKQSLDLARRENLLPLAVVATAGTTDFGSIDHLPEIAALAEEAGAWFHVDAAYGGALLFSERHREKLKGIERAASLGMDFHKLFWQPIPCSVFLLRDAANFDSIKMHADYLNPEGHEEEGVPDLVTTSLLTTRRFDALKLWISLQTLGRGKLAAMMDRTLELTAHSARIIRQMPHLELMAEPQLSTVVFRYLPARADLKCDELNSAIRKRLFESGAAVIGHTRVHGRQCLKFTCMNPCTTEAQMEALLQSIVKQGEEIESGK